MKILMVNGSVMLHLDLAEAEAVAEALRHSRAGNPLLDEITRQLDICLQHKKQNP